MKRFLLALLLVSVQAAPVFSRDDYPRSTTLDAIHYRIRLDIKQEGEQISASAEILFEATGDGVNQVPLDFGGLAVSEVSEEKQPARFNHAGGKLLVTLGKTYRRGERFWIGVKYHGRPSDGLFIKKSKFGHRTIFADNWPNRARHWFPGIDHPYDKATVEFLVTTPARYDVIANGALVEVTSNHDGTKLTHWRMSVPIPTYCMVVGATEFSILNVGTSHGVQLLYYLYPQDRDNGIKDYGRTLQMFDYYHNLIGPFPYEKLALVQSSTQFGGMENSTAIFFDEKAFDGSGRLEGTVAHEIAHQWFGDSVTEADWHHLWLSEGFATYFENLFFEHADGRDKFVERMLADKETYLKAYGETAPPIYDPSITDLFKLLNRNNYQKGGWVLHMLRREMGDRLFFEAVRDYYRTYRDRTALTADLQKVMEFHAGRPLDWFFKQWIYEPGYPILDAAWEWNEPSRELRLRVAQKQQKTLFRIRLDVDIKVGDKTRREVVDLREREHTFTFKLDSKPQGLALDPDEWVLKVLTLRGE